MGDTRHAAGSDSVPVSTVEITTVGALLDSALAKIEQGYTALGLDEAVLGLRCLRGVCDAPTWERDVLGACRAHPIADVLAEDPFTRRCLHKPRGYAGDAEALDYVFHPRLPAGVSGRGAAIFGYTTDGPAPRSLRARASMIAAVIDRMAAERPLRVLAVMAGHLWEARLAGSVRSGAVAKYVAFDQDAESLAFVEAAGYGECMAVYQGSVGALLRGRSVFRNFDLVYSGLTDNLSDAAARRFAAALFGAVAPGGRLILSNFAPELVDAGYMEAFMDWRLFYRAEQELRALTADLPAGGVASARTYRDPYGNIVFLEAERGNYEGRIRN